VPEAAESNDWGGYKSDVTMDEKVMVALVKASELFKKDSDAIFKNYGLTFSQYNVLRVLNNSSNGQNTVSMASKIMLVSSPNMTGIAKRLERSGLIIRKAICTMNESPCLKSPPRAEKSWRISKQRTMATSAAI